MSKSPTARHALIVQNNLSPFGNKLVKSEFVNKDKIQQALIESRQSKKPLTQVLERLTGKQLPPDLIREYKKQQLFELKILYGVDSLDPEISQIDTTQVDSLINTLIPIDICRSYRLVPLSKKANPHSVLVAMVDPDNLAALDDLKRVLHPHDLEMQRMVITQEDYQQIFSKYLKIFYGVDSLDPEISQIDTTQVDSLIDTLIPIEICRSYQLVPLSEKANPRSVLVAMVDPDNLSAFEDLKKILPQGLEMQWMVITQEDYEQIISKYLDEEVKRQSKPKKKEEKFDLEIDLTHLDTSMADEGDDEESDVDLNKALSS
ncbi:MAG: hypothetical protein GDA38_21165 [Hormoscilla sp. SP12CHS1]|nr:hypothetical protein [Hormoscilla sp. SP12CHS1]